jgi:hypothetical protein
MQVSAQQPEVFLETKVLAAGFQPEIVLLRQACLAKCMMLARMLASTTESKWLLFKHKHPFFHVLSKLKRALEGDFNSLMAGASHHRLEPSLVFMSL